MFNRYRTHFIPVPGLIFSVIGLVYSLSMSFSIGQEVFCFTSGCAVVSDFKLFGISPWWVSCAMFALILALCVLRMRLFAKVVASFALFGDCLFLACMLLIAPCTSCLTIAIIIFCTWAALRLERATLIMPRRIIAGTLGGLWALLFTLNAGYAISEITPPWAITPAKSEAKVTLYFSPSCPACREAVRVFGATAQMYPVAETDEDYNTIAYMAKQIEQGESPLAALENVLAGNADTIAVYNELSLTQKAWLRIKLMRNMAKASQTGSQVLPVITFMGMPQSWASTTALAAENFEADNAGSEPATESNTTENTNAAGSGAETDSANTGANTGSAEANSAETGNAQSNSTGTPAASANNANGRIDLPLNLNQTLECGRASEAPCE